MHDQEKSDSAIVAVKSPNKAGTPAAEAVEQRAGTKGNADQQSTHRTQIRARVTQALGGCSAMSIPTANLDPERTRAGGSFAMRRMVCVQSMLYCFFSLGET